VDVFKENRALEVLVGPDRGVACNVSKNLVLMKETKD
jgi:hypothetical protein